MSEGTVAENATVGDEPEGMPYTWAVQVEMSGAPGDEYHKELENKITVVVDGLREKYPGRFVSVEISPCIMAAPTRQI